MTPLDVLLPLARSGFGLPALVLGLLAPGARADLIVVDDKSGPNGIQEAVDTAAEGDTVLVRTGYYSGSVLIDGKSLTLVADASGVTFPADGGPFTNHYQPSIRVTNLAASQAVVVRNFDLSWGMAVEFCEGAVWIDSVDVAGTLTDWDADAPVDGLSVRASHRVTVTGSTLRGQRGFTSGGQFSNGARGLYARNAHVYVFDSLVLGGNGHGGVFTGVSTNGGGGAFLRASTVRAVGCAFEGGRGGNAGCPTPGVGNGGVGVRFYQPVGESFFQHGATTIVGGESGTGFGCPDPTVAPAFAGTSAATIVELPDLARGVSVDGPLSGGEIVTFDVTGAEGDLPLVLLSLVHDPIPVANGVVLVGLPLADAFLLGTLPASGEATLSFPVPSIAVGSELTYHAQAAFLDAGGAIWFGSGSVLVLAEPAP